MSEMRKRRGEQEAAEDVTETEEQTTVRLPPTIKYVKGEHDDLYMTGGSRFKTMELEDIIRMSVVMKAQSKMLSASNATQEIKDKLELDPYNMKLILQLGLRYMDHEYQYHLATNVLLRGFKRVSELPDSADRSLFLTKLCEASFRNFQFKQAHTVYMAMEEPDGGFERKAYLLLGCNVFAQVNDPGKALQTFCKLVEGEEFEVAIGFWAATALALRKVNAFEASKNSMKSKVRSGQYHHMDEERLKMVESWSVMSLVQEEETKSWKDQCMEGKPPRELMCGACAFILLLITYMFYVLEQRSLKRLNLA